MDICESLQALPRHRAVETRKPPLVSAKKNNAVTHRTRYSSPSTATSSSPRRCSSPNLTRTTTQSSQLLHKRAQSADRRRSSTPSPPGPSTPVHESSVNVQMSSKRITGSRLQESLWPSTMRSLSVSFQSDTISIPVSKKEKPTVSNSDRTLRPTSNVAHKQLEAPTIRKPSPDRKRSPLKGKNASDHSENSKPVESSHSRLIDQHRWPSRIAGKISSNAVHSSSEFADKAIRTLPSSVPCTGSSPRKLSLSNETSKPFQKSSRDTSRLIMLPENDKIRSEVKHVDDSSLLVVSPQKFVSASSSDKIGLLAPPVRSQSLPTPGIRPRSPSKTSVLSSSSSRGLSPSRSRPLTPPSRGVSPSRIRPTNLYSQSNISVSVLSFIADFKRGKKGAAHIEDAHQLRLLYNRYLQWRFANARAESVLYIQNATVERTLYNVWNTTLSVRDSVTRKRINLRLLKLELKLNSVLNDQMAYLNEWASLESDHANALAGAIEDLKAGILRLPVTGWAIADSEDLKVAICSAVDVMQAMGSTICSLLTRVEGTNDLVSELAIVAAQEKAMLDECEELLALAAAMQAEENSLRTQLMQMKQALETNK
ncbi:AUGMIN subunit 8 isoform X2 [Neltuma alba]|uniref:AUGMIN subunit 8 isoform X2 n=1 Tax=Neltuma alba TaxID=207710 RepID=UPI0010A3A740|nr:AUGMIN subunit 8 isoform X2 [Prosopis alba]